MARLVGKPWMWVLLVGSIFAVQLGSAMTKKVPEPPPILFPLPAFTLTDQHGHPYGSADLAGKLYVANFIFTSCKTACPLLSTTMQSLQKRMRNMGDAAMLVSFSVDPERDTPERLKDYAEKLRAHPTRWRFLTGDNSAVQDAVVKGFKMPMDPGEPVETTNEQGQREMSIMDITHGTRFVLVDAKGRVRGFYEATREGMDDLVYDMALVANLPDPPAADPVATDPAAALSR